MEKTVFVPVDLEEFLTEIREIVREEISKGLKDLPAVSTAFTVPTGMVEKPLYRIEEVCQLFEISRPTMYEWVRTGSLHPKKLGNKVYFMGSQIRGMLHSLSNQEDNR